MKEEDGSRYLSPLVKQDLAKLDTDGDTRRLAVKSLNLFVEQLDASTLPRFISQIAESRESGATRCYAISLYEEMARVHGKLVVPHISKVVAALVRSSSASGSSPQLQIACARVTAALARYGIDSNTSQEDAEEIIREICTPLIEALSGKLEPVAATAAACIHALAETEKWKYAREEIVHEVCQRTTVALGEKSTRTAAHLQLVRILASVNPDTISIHGASLLRAGEEILKVTANPWQLRKAAAQLLQSVLTILDKETLETELNSALHALDSCRLDKMVHVRTAASEALHTAKMLASGNNATHTSFGMAASTIRKSTERNDRSPWFHEDVPISPVSKRGTSSRAPMSPQAVSLSPVPKRGIVSPRAPMSPNRAGVILPRPASPSPRSSPRAASPRTRATIPSPKAASPTSQESRLLSFSPASTSTSGSIQVPSARNKGRGRAQRAPLYPARSMNFAHSPRFAFTPGTSPSSSTTTVEECESPSRRLNVKDFNVRTRSTGFNGVYPEEDGAGHGDKYLRPRAPLTSGASLPLLPTQLDCVGVEIQKLKIAQDLKDVGTNTPRLEHLRQTSKENTKSMPSGEDSELAARQNSNNGVEVVLPRLKLGGINSFDLHSGIENTTDGRTPMLKASSISLQVEIPNHEDARIEKENGNCTPIEVEKHEIFISEMPIRAQCSATGAEIDTGKPNRGGAAHGHSHLLEHRSNALAHLDVNLDDEKKSLAMANDLLPFVIPKRLVRSLSSLSNLDSSRASLHDQDMKLLQDESALTSARMLANTADAAELDGETSSEAGWSVRDNPIASEESYRSETSDDEADERRRGAHDFPRLRKVGSADSFSPREIHMILPTPKVVRSVDDEATLNFRGRADNPDEACSPTTAGADHVCPSCVFADLTSTLCRMPTPTRPIKDMDADKAFSPNGLSSLLHEDEMNRKNMSSTCSCQLCATKSSGHCQEAASEESECDSSSEKKTEKHEDGKCVIRMVTHNWKKLCWYTETALGGSLCLVLALPLVMVVAKALNGSRDCHLVPT